MNDHRPKIALYSHDTMGLGHMRRNVLIARALAESRLSAVTLMIAGAPEAVDVCNSAGVSCIALPPLAKEADGSYTSRTLEVRLQDLITLRAQTIRAALEAFGPDAVIVDNVPRGAKRELDAALSYIRAETRARCVLGLRDVLDAPHTVRREWDLARNVDAIREFYDEVWIYGDRAVCDPVTEYGLPSWVARRTHHLGYLDQRPRLASMRRDASARTADLEIGPGRLAMCVVGGGQDGGALAEAFAEAGRPDDMHGVIVTGPFMPPGVVANLRRIADAKPRLRVIDFVEEPLSLLVRADRIVAMGGYNSVCEILSLAKPALVVPRVKPRREQAIRAERLRSLDLVDVLSADALSPRRVADWLSSDLPPQVNRSAVDLNGLARLVARLEHLLAATDRVTRRRDSLPVGAGRAR
jgi:predicted glycosyltransferase